VNTASERANRTGRRIGYSAIIIIFALFWWMVGHLQEWEWLPFLTNDFDRVVPWIRASLSLSIVFNLAFLFWDPGWLTHAAEALASLVNLFVGLKMLQVFPFDFSGQEFNWEGVARGFLLFSLFAATVAIPIHLTRAVKASRRPSRRYYD